MIERHKKKQKQKSLSDELSELIKIPINPFSESDKRKIKRRL